MAVDEGLLDRIESKILEGEDGHRWWNAFTRDGYALINVGGVPTHVHRLLWIEEHGQPETRLRNTCGNRNCVATEHWTDQSTLVPGSGRFDPINWRAVHLRNKYGMTLDDYDVMLRSQSGKCAICRKKPEEGALLQVDHCHKTGRIRGLLCWRCNRAIGYLMDSPRFARSAADYLEAS